MKHTPGPWQYSFEGGTVAFLTEADGTTIAKLSVTENSTAHKTLASNARLIAAAPDLLRVLVQLEQACADEGVQGMDSLLAAARAAIAKAMGECTDEDGDVMCSACNCWKAARANCS